jgi:hypothetical protein
MSGNAMMSASHMDKTTMEFMVWVVEIVAAKYFDRDKTAAYRAMNRSGLWDIYAENYDTTHTLGAEYILEEAGDILRSKGEMNE